MKKIICLALVLVSVAFGGCDKKTEIGLKSRVEFTVCDGFSGLPMENVTVIVPECELVLQTGSNGKTEEADILIADESRLPYPDGVGTFSVLAFKEGYNDFALFFAMAEEGEVRRLKVYMFSLDTPFNKGVPLTTVESPEGEWFEDLVEFYKSKYA